MLSHLLSYGILTTHLRGGGSITISILHMGKPEQRELTNASPTPQAGAVPHQGPRALTSSSPSPFTNNSLNGTESWEKALFQWNLKFPF